MTTFLIILCIMSYLFVGGIAAGIFTDGLDLDFSACILFTLFWPLLIGCVLLVFIIMLPVKIGEKIKERFEE